MSRLTTFDLMQVDSFETYVVAVSGGKDSTAAALWALGNLPREKLRFVNNPTGAAWPFVDGYLTYLENRLGIKVERVCAGDRSLPPRAKEWQTWASATNLLDMVRARGMWPSFWQRYCTKYLKMWPLRLYASEFENPLLVFGDRGEESKHRRELPVLGDDVFVDLKDYRFPNFRPILDWLEDDVWQFLFARGIEPNPVYLYSRRCSCWCCPLGGVWPTYNFCRLYPHLARPAVVLEEEIGHTWKHRRSIGNLLKQARMQLPLFDIQGRADGV